MLAFKHLSLDDTKYGRNIRKHMKKVKSMIPSSLIICDSIFNEAIIVGNVDKEGFILLYLDENDYFNVLLSIVSDQTNN